MSLYIYVQINISNLFSLFPVHLMSPHIVEEMKRNRDGEQLTQPVTSNHNRYGNHTCIQFTIELYLYTLEFHLYGLK